MKPIVRTLAFIIFIIGICFIAFIPIFVMPFKGIDYASDKVNDIAANWVELMEQYMN